MYMKLENQYAGSMALRKMSVLMEFFSLAMGDTEQMVAFQSRTEGLLKDIATTGVNLDKDVIVVRVLSALPKSYNSFLSAWESLPAADQTLENLMARLINEDSRRREEPAKAKSKPSDAFATDYDFDDYSGYYARGGTRGGPRGRSSRGGSRGGQRGGGSRGAKGDFLASLPRTDRDSCFNCGAKGHWRSECQREDRADHTCRKCNNVGHFEIQCAGAQSLARPNRGGRGGANVIQGDYGENGETEPQAGFERASFVGEAFKANLVFDRDFWLSDSGATEHMTPRREWFSTYAPSDCSEGVRVGNGAVLPVAGIGKVKVSSWNGVSWDLREMDNVLHVPDLGRNLFSEVAMLDKGFKEYSDRHEKVFTFEDRTIALGERVGKSFRMKMNTVLPSECNVSRKCTSFKIWHGRLGHQNIRYCKSILNKHGVNDVKVDMDSCEACMFGKQHREPFPTSTSRSKHAADLIHVDLNGPMQVTSNGGNKYFMLLRDDYSNFRRVYFLEKKSEAQPLLLSYFNFVKTQQGREIKTVRSDRGTEFCNDAIEQLSRERGFVHQTTVGYSPEQNGCIERDNRTVVELARSLLQASDLPEKWWGEAVSTAVYILNLTGQTQMPGKCPLELWNPEAKVDIQYLRVFGTNCYVHVPDEKRKKWDAKSWRGIFMGYSLTMKGYRVLDPETNSVDCFRDVVFENEDLSSVGVVSHPMVNETDEVLNPGVGEDRIKEDGSGDEEVQVDGKFAVDEAPLVELFPDQHAVSPKKIRRKIYQKVERD